MSRGAAAMAIETLRNLQEDITCPICLELLREPLSLDCGHSFCQACITASSQESSKAGENSCPVCRIIYDPGNMRPNWHLTNLVERLRGVNLSQEEEEKKDLCEHHGEKLLLFCKEDWMPICWLCERSKEHRGHHTLLIEEAANEYKEKLLASLEQLRKKQEEAEQYETALREHRTSCQNQIEEEIYSVQKKFQQIRDIIDLEEQKELQKLRKEEKKILHGLALSEEELVKQSEFTRGLISDLEHKLQASAKEMLHNVNDVLERSEDLTLTKPETFSLEYLDVFQTTDLIKKLEAFDELKSVQYYWVQMTLKVPDNNPAITVSLDGRQVRCAGNRSSQQRSSTGICDNYVLGSKAIKSGKRYWEVDVSDKQEWMVGVCHITSIRSSKFNQQNNYKFNLSFNESPPSQWCPDPLPVPIKQQSLFHPQFCYWVIGLQNNSQNKVFVDTSDYNSRPLTLSMTVPPCRIGVFVDYEEETVSFYDITNHGFLMYEFSSCSFTDKIFPYFNLMNCSGPITLCTPSLM
ncbi:tripartite motif-containing protein 5-like [Sorex fumeus]|uniref:tripartite motif-containing protein 5-like n=1 Tax=Sorex fumeus TaxID=62283 RepID=UPI0024ADF1A3|nr:tripartite motif-containing protein 5-like [Sorex fumeus]XP_055972110.1 tripartite motif-containing protein 5-like [Sorex fumeus]